MLPRNRPVILGSNSSKVVWYDAGTTPTNRNLDTVRQFSLSCELRVRDVSTTMGTDVLLSERSLAILAASSLVLVSSLT
uniref:Uncharacterized protein n=1 Tax=Babesia bovis TaxID=5865 RepID=S6CAF1_BABBO|nr:hypothetical protein [Babesia bovis]